jgi:hypothetical protein
MGFSLQSFAPLHAAVRCLQRLYPHVVETTPGLPQTASPQATTRPKKAAAQKRRPSPSGSCSTGESATSEGG